MLESSKLSLKPLYAAPAIPAVIAFPQPEIRFIAAVLLAWGGVRLWQEVVRHQQRAKTIKESMSLAGCSVVVTNNKGKVLSVNSFFQELMGFAEKDVMGLQIEKLVAPRYSADFIDRVWEELRDKGFWEGELWTRRGDGTEFPAWVRAKVIYRNNEEVRGYLFVSTDLQEQKHKELLIWHSGRHDLLTGLPNRQRIHDLLALYIPRMCKPLKEKRSLGLAIIDIDGFQMVNNSLGADAGDALLNCVANRLQASEKTDLVGRIGADEFFIAYKADNESHEDWVLHIRGLFKKPFWAAGKSIRLSVSMGSCQVPSDIDGEEDTATVLQYIELALARAKISGSNTDRRYSKDLDSLDAANMVMVQALRVAIDLKEGLALHYQTQHSPQTGEVLGIEALLRWRWNQNDQISPADFIPMAERYGMMEELGAWVIHEAVKQASVWAKEHSQPPVVWINISAIQLFQHSLETILDNATKLHHVGPQAIGLEITESQLLDERAGSMIERLLSLKKRGFLIAIDDFGTGHSSLSYIRDFPIDKVKLDRAFISSLPNDRTNAAIVESVINIANQLQLEVVAEGVETEDQLMFLQQKGCHAIQGFYFSRPKSARNIHLSPAAIPKTAAACGKAAAK